MELHTCPNTCSDLRRRGHYTETNLERSRGTLLLKVVGYLKWLFIKTHDHAEFVA
jgi:hypothetical protein